MADSSANIIAVVPAAGSGSRMGAATPKQYLPLRGMPMLWHTVHALLRQSRISRVYVVIDEYDAHFDQLDLTTTLAPAVTLRLGGDTRARTVLNALESLISTLAEDDWVMVHDAARPCLDGAAIERLLQAVVDDPVGGLLAIPVRDTLKRARPDGRVDATVPREHFWQAQTPQMFRFGLLLRALRQADLTVATDEASAIEGLGVHPRLVMGSARNLKVTYPEDVALAEVFLDR